MTIEYHPPALASIIKSQLANKRLKNREGILTCSCGELNEEDRVLSLEIKARAHSQQKPDCKIRLIEKTCTSYVF